MMGLHELIMDFWFWKLFCRAIRTAAGVLNSIRDCQGKALCRRRFICSTHIHFSFLPPLMGGHAFLATHQRRANGARSRLSDSLAEMGPLNHIPGDNASLLIGRNDWE